MSHTATGSARVVNVAAGVENADRTVLLDKKTPVRDGRHQALAVLIGKWINEGHTIETAEIPAVPILTGDVYEWAPGGFFGQICATARQGRYTGAEGRAHRS